MTDPTVQASRRVLLKGAASFPLLSCLAALHAREAMAAGNTTRIVSPYGPIAPVNDLTTGLPLLKLPAGFSYKSFGWTGDKMTNGLPCPGAHDGMAVVTTRRVGRSTEMVLIRNHELSGTSSSAFFGAPAVYDLGTTSGQYSAGGNTNLTFRDGNWVSVSPSLGGTRTNCAGGPTPWGSWLTCEEVGSDSASNQGKKHGYVFEVAADPVQTSAQPLIGMGRFAHEAIAVDPATGIVYQSEDSSGKSGFYRYIPTVTQGSLGSLAQGGTLQMAKVVGQNNVNVAPAQLGQTYALEWVTINNPDQNRGNATGLNGQTITSAAGPFVQGWQQGALRMNRGEGMWHDAGKIYIMDTAGGTVNLGAIWELDLATQVMTCIYSTSGASVGNMGDNITVSPRGGIVICEDASNAANDEFGVGQRLMGLSAAGETFIFAKNNINLTAGQLTAAGKSTSLAGAHNTNEFAGACFDPSGRWLFVNIQTPGITFAITGPWANGSI